MRRNKKRLLAFVMAILMTLSTVHSDGKAVLDGVYFSAVNEQLLELNRDAMPFYSGGILYISNRFFQETDFLDVRYVRNNSMGLAMLYSKTTDLRFDLVNQTIYDKQGTYYSGSAIEKGGYVFFPAELVCSHFRLTLTISKTDTVPLIRIKSSTAILSDSSFIVAASMQMSSRYAAYERMVSVPETPKVDPQQPSTQQPSTQQPTTQQPSTQQPSTQQPSTQQPSTQQPSTQQPSTQQPTEQTPEKPRVQAEDGQRVYLLLASESEETTRRAMEILAGYRATVRLTLEQLAQADLLRALIGSGHGVALMAREESAEGVREEILRARELVWDGTCSLLQQVWYDGDAEINVVLEELGCVSVMATLDRRDSPVRSKVRADALLTLIGQHKEDLSVYLGADGACLDGLDDLLGYLVDAEFGLSAWRLTTKCG